MDQTGIFLSILLCAGVQGVFLLNHRFLVRGMLFSMVTGICCLYIVNIVGSQIGFSMPLTVPALAVSATMGVPGCIFLLFTKLICGV